MCDEAHVRRNPLCDEAHVRRNLRVTNSIAVYLGGDGLKLIIGLGNPGKKYANTRHNIGFTVVERLVALLGAGAEKKQAQALVSVAIVGDEKQKVMLVKPQTYMNLSGDSLWELINFYRDGIADFIVVHDDLDLPLGKMRFRGSGGAGGHRGIKSITQRLGSEKYDRLKIGVGRPPGQVPAEAFVLQAFSADEKALIDETVSDAADALRFWLGSGCEQAAARYNGTAGVGTDGVGAIPAKAAKAPKAPRTPPPPEALETSLPPETQTAPKTQEAQETPPAFSEN